MIDEKKLRPFRLDLSSSRTITVKNRKNILTIENLATPESEPIPEWEHPELQAVVDSIIMARQQGAPVIWSMGAHVIKCGLSRYLIELIKKGFITHIAGNGAVSIHDFELAFMGGTSEYVPDAIESGTFGMWEETGSWMNQAIQEGYGNGLGYGSSLAFYIDRYSDRFPYKNNCVLYQAYNLGIPATYHISIGTDIIHQHPAADFQSLGGASGIDFSIYCHSVSRLENGVFLNFGSAVTGPEVFLKALSICRNQRFKVERITTVNFDIIPLGNYRREIEKDDYHYFYRPRKNIINRPTSLGGKGYYIEGNHKNTIPSLYHSLISRDKETGTNE
ncbi:MAG: hypothetical protein ACLFUI_10675 [Halanaerobiales bacterium]